MISVLSAGWLDKKRSEVKESTIIKYECIVTRHITPALGDCAPERLTAGRIDEFSRGLLKSGLSAKTVHDILVVLRGVLVYAAAIAGNRSAVPMIRYPARERKEMRVLTREEQSRLVGYLRDIYKKRLCFTAVFSVIPNQASLRTRRRARVRFQGQWRVHRPRRLVRHVLHTA